MIHSVLSSYLLTLAIHLPLPSDPRMPGRREAQPDRLATRCGRCGDKWQTGKQGIKWLLEYNLRCFTLKETSKSWEAPCRRSKSHDNCRTFRAGSPLRHPPEDTWSMGMPFLVNPLERWRCFFRSPHAQHFACYPSSGSCQEDPRGLNQT